MLQPVEGRLGDYDRPRVTPKYAEQTEACQGQNGRKIDDDRLALPRQFQPGGHFVPPPVEAADAQVWVGCEVNPYFRFRGAGESCIRVERHRLRAVRLIQELDLSPAVLKAPDDWRRVEHVAAPDVNELALRQESSGRGEKIYNL